MYLGIDLGTSAAKTVLVDDDGAVVAQASAPLDLSRPQPLWSEQDPEAWWAAVEQTLHDLKSRTPKEMAAVKCAGLSGQMHGATLLDAQGEVIRPAILWNDGRSEQECRDLEKAVPETRAITGNIAMPGFTAPKLLWVRNNEPGNFARIAKVLLPKDYIRFRMTGGYASDMSDSAGTTWLNVADRDWSDKMLDATDLTREQMPDLYEGTAIAGRLRSDVASDWGTGEIPVAAGGGDNAAGAAGVGVVSPGSAFVSLGTSGVYFVSESSYRPNPESAVHTFCHCTPDTWHKMAVLLSAASCLTWVSRLTGAASEAEATAGLDAEVCDGPIFLPYLSGERTPHNDPAAKGVFFGLTHETEAPDLVRAVLEGVAFAFADGEQVLRESGTEIADVSAIGGGARSELWVQMMADVLRRPLAIREENEVGPAYGAARLARIAVTGEPVAEVCTEPPLKKVVEPDRARGNAYAERHAVFQRLYVDIKERFRD